jgi:hypothetical protein
MDRPQCQCGGNVLNFVSAVSCPVAHRRQAGARSSVRNVPFTDHRVLDFYVALRLHNAAGSAHSPKPKTRNIRESKCFN